MKTKKNLFTNSYWYRFLLSSFLSCWWILINLLLTRIWFLQTEVLKCWPHKNIIIYYHFKILYYLIFSCQNTISSSYRLVSHFDTHKYLQHNTFHSDCSFIRLFRGRRCRIRFTRKQRRHHRTSLQFSNIRQSGVTLFVKFFPSDVVLSHVHQ